MNCWMALPRFLPAYVSLQQPAGVFMPVERQAFAAPTAGERAAGRTFTCSIGDCVCSDGTDVVGRLLPADRQMLRSAAIGGDIKSSANRKELAMKMPARGAPRCCRSATLFWRGCGALAGGSSRRRARPTCRALQQPLQSLSGRCKLPLAATSGAAALQAAQSGAVAHGADGWAGVSLPAKCARRQRPAGPLPGPALSAPGYQR